MKIPLKKGRVTSSLHNSDFTDTIFLKRLIFRQAKQEQYHHCLHAVQKGERESRSRAELPQTDASAGTRVNSFMLAVIDPGLEIK